MMAGRLNKPILIIHTETSSETSTGFEKSEDRVNYAARADVQWGTGRRETANLEIVFSYDVTFIVWDFFSSKVREGDLIYYQSKKYMIVSMESVPESKMLYLRCESA